MLVGDVSFAGGDKDGGVVGDSISARISICFTWGGETRRSSSFLCFANLSRHGLAQYLDRHVLRSVAQAPAARPHACNPDVDGAGGRGGGGGGGVGLEARWVSVRAALVPRDGGGGADGGGGGADGAPNARRGAWRAALVLVGGGSGPWLAPRCQAALGVQRGVRRGMRRGVRSGVRRGGCGVRGGGGRGG